MNGISRIGILWLAGQTQITWQGGMSFRFFSPSNFTMEGMCFYCVFLLINGAKLIENIKYFCLRFISYFKQLNHLNLTLGHQSVRMISCILCVERKQSFITVFLGTIYVLFDVDNDLVLWAILQNCIQREITKLKPSRRMAFWRRTCSFKDCFLMIALFINIILNEVLNIKTKNTELLLRISMNKNCLFQSSYITVNKTLKTENPRHFDDNFIILIMGCVGISFISI